MRPNATAATLSAVALLVGACGGNDSFGSSEETTGPNFVVAGQADFEEFEICKLGSSATFDYTVTDRTTSAVTNGQVTLQDGDCYVVTTSGGNGADVTVTENVPSGFQLDKVDISVLTSGPTLTTRTESGPTISDFVSGGGSGGLRGVIATFYNSAIPQTPTTGRMTGGGKQIEVGGIAITRGFTVHCDITLSNNIEINWADNKWHLDKPIDTAQCFDDPNIDQKPPKAPLDTFIGTATGRLNGVDGSTLEFTFVDAGEPGRDDMAALRIRDENGVIVLDVPLSYLTNGNIQAHEDQPHK